MKLDQETLVAVKQPKQQGETFKAKLARIAALIVENNTPELGGNFFRNLLNKQ